MNYVNYTPKTAINKFLMLLTSLGIKSAEDHATQDFAAYRRYDNAIELEVKLSRFSLKYLDELSKLAPPHTKIEHCSATYVMNGHMAILNVKAFVI